MYLVQNSRQLFVNPAKEILFKIKKNTVKLNEDCKIRPSHLRYWTSIFLYQLKPTRVAIETHIKSRLF